MASYDISFCSYEECKHKDCRRHLNNLPKDLRFVSVADFKCENNKECKYNLWKECVQCVESVKI